MLPKIPKGFVTNLPGVIPTFIGPRQFIFLLSFAVIVILTTFFILDQGLPKPSGRINVNPGLNLEEINFPNITWKNSVKENIKLANLEKDEEKSFELYQRVFTLLLSVYTADHNPKTREQAEKLGGFINTEFPRLAQTGNFNVPCLDSDCGKTNYPDEILEIMEKLIRLDVIDKDALSGSLREFESAALTSDTNSQFSSYFNVFNIIVGEKKRTKDERFTEIAEKMKSFLRNNYSDNYSQIENWIPGAFEI